MIQLQEISKSFGQRVLFSEVNIVLGPKERVGLVGRNGMGKSTLFKIIQGEENADGGHIAIPKGYSLGALEQHLDFTGETILAEVVQALPKDLVYDHWRAEKILFGLGFTQEDLEKHPSTFSGGYQIRVKLAKVLVSAPSLLLLDEPTNYLDIVSLRWLSQFLKDFDGEVLVITHDRAFMDDVCTHIMGIHRKKVKKVRGNTKKYYEQLEADEEIYEQTRLNQERKKKELEGFIEKFSAKASKARQANSKKKIIEKMDEIDVLEEIADLRFSFTYKDIPSKFPLEAKSISFGYEEQEDLFSEFSLSIAKGDCIGIIGKNGKGKSTLLNVIAEELKARTGSLWKAPGVLEGHFGQTNIERLHPKNTVVQEILGANDELSITGVRGICGSMMFSGDDADKPVSVLSGGEKARVMLGKILAKKTNLLYLDEPTNHLDLESIEILCDEIERFKGCVFLVTHSELLLSRLVNKLVVFRQGRAFLFDGNYQEFLTKIGWDDDLPQKPRKEKVVQQKSSTVDKSTVNEHKVSEIEEEIIKLEEIISKFENLCQFKSSQGEDIREITETLKKLNEKVEIKFAELEEFS